MGFDQTPLLQRKQLHYLSLRRLMQTAMVFRLGLLMRLAMHHSHLLMRLVLTRLARCMPARLHDCNV